MVHYVNPIEYEVALKQKEEASRIAGKVVRLRKEELASCMYVTIT